MIEKTRVIQLASGDLWAGAEAVVYELCRKLSGKEDIELCIILLNEGRLYELCSSLGVRTILLNERRMGTPKIIFEMIKIARSFKPDIIHSHRYKENIIASVVSIFSGMPKLITTIHGMPETKYSSKTKALFKINDFLLKHLFSGIVAVSIDIFRKLSEKYSRADLIWTIYNGIDIDKIDRKEPCSGSSVVVGSAGRLTPIKDFSLFIDIAGIVLEKFPDVKFVIAGEGNEKGMLEEKIRKMNLSGRVILKGHVENMHEFYNSIDIYLNTSVHEGIPMTILEAMARGIPVAAPLIGGIPEIITSGKDGFIAGKRSAEEFSDILTDLINSPDKRKIIGMEARRRIEDAFTTDAMASGYCRLYEDCSGRD